MPSLQTGWEEKGGKHPKEYFPPLLYYMFIIELA